MTLFLSAAQLLALHQEQLRRYGGSDGVRDRGLLEAAAARPAMTFGGEDLYPDIAAKATALLHTLVLNHPVVDGNTRVAAHAAVLFALLNGEESLATSEELVTMTLATAEGRVAPEALAIWWRQRLRRVED
jgi:death-on-curing protein